MGTINSGCQRRSTRCETVSLQTAMDVERALGSVPRPRRIQVAAPLLSDKTSPRLRQFLRRAGCLELSIAGKNPAAPRRVYESEVVHALQQLARKQSHKLRSLELQNIDVQRQGDSHFVGRLANCLGKFSNLEELHLRSCRWDVELFPEIARVVLDQLPRLQKITLHLCDPDSEHTELMIDTATHLVQHRPLLQFLACSDYPRDKWFWQQVANSKTLSHLALTCHPDRDLPYLDQLQQNTSITTLELFVSHNVNLQPLTQQCLHGNTTLSSLILHLQQDPTRVANMLSEVLQRDNLTLKQVHLLCFNPFIGYEVRVRSPNLEFLCKLNRQGRHHLWRVSQDQQDWIDTITSNQFDTSSVFYSLRANPAILVV